MNFGLPPTEEEFCVCKRRLIDRQEASMQVNVGRVKFAKLRSRGAARSRLCETDNRLADRRPLTDSFIVQ